MRFIIISQDGSALNLGTDSISWWNLHGIGCRPVPNLSNDLLSPETAQRHVPVDGCLLNYEYIEVLHAAVHLFLAVSTILKLNYWKNILVFFFSTP